MEALGFNHYGPRFEKHSFGTTFPPARDCQEGPAAADLRWPGGGTAQDSEPEPGGGRERESQLHAPAQKTDLDALFGIQGFICFLPQAALCSHGYAV